MRSYTRRSTLLGLVAVLGVAWLPAAGRAASLAFTGELELYMAGAPYSAIAGLPAVFHVTGSGVATVNGSGPGGHLNSLTLPASPFATTAATVPVTDPAVFPINGFQATVHNGAGSFAGGGGIMALFGVAKVCLFYQCGTLVPGNLSVPLTVVGAGGVTTVKGAVNVTVVGGAWTTGTAAVGSLTAMGFAHGPNGFTSSTAQNSGVIQLVTPIFVSTNIGSFPVWPLFATLTLHFVPEPGTFALLAGGLGALALGGRARMRRH
jgi:hypothetical protein